MLHCLLKSRFGFVKTGVFDEARCHFAPWFEQPGAVATSTRIPEICCGLNSIRDMAIKPHSFYELWCKSSYWSGWRSIIIRGSSQSKEEQVGSALHSLVRLWDGARVQVMFYSRNHAPFIYSFLNIDVRKQYTREAQICWIFFCARRRAVFYRLIASNIIITCNEYLVLSIRSRGSPPAHFQHKHLDLERKWITWCPYSISCNIRSMMGFQGT